MDGKNQLLITIMALCAFESAWTMESDHSTLPNPIPQAIVLIESDQTKEHDQTKIGQELFIASLNGNIADINDLLKKGADVNHRFVREPQNTHGWAQLLAGNTPLMAAAHMQNIQALQILIDAGADVNSLNSNGYNALMMTFGGHKLLTEKKFHVFLDLFLAAGGDLFHRNNYSETALVQAAQSPLGEFAQHLIAALIRFTQTQKKSVKNWLLVDQRLRSEGRGLVKNLTKPIAIIIRKELALDMRNRLIRAGGLNALLLSQAGNNHWAFRVLEANFNQDMLEKYALQATLLPKIKESK